MIITKTTMPVINGGGGGDAGLVDSADKETVQLVAHRSLGAQAWARDYSRRLLLLQDGRHVVKDDNDCNKHYWRK
jgi:hypothetical protein